MYMKIEIFLKALWVQGVFSLVVLVMCIGGIYDGIH